MTEDIPAEFFLEERSEEEDEGAFWQQPLPSDTKAFMSSIWKGMKKIFKGQTKLRQRVEEQNARLKRIEEGLQHSQSMGPSTSASPSRHPR